MIFVLGFPGISIFLVKTYPQIDIINLKRHDRNGLNYIFGQGRYDLWTSGGLVYGAYTEKDQMDYISACLERNDVDLNKQFIRHQHILMKVLESSYLNFELFISNKSLRKK